MPEYPLPISPHDPRFGAFCQRKQLDYIAAERWRYGQAINRLPAWWRGDRHSEVINAGWNALDLHPQTHTELQARLRQLDGMEWEALYDPNWLSSVVDIAVFLHNRV